jgi:hypothetical protein
MRRSVAFLSAALVAIPLSAAPVGAQSQQEVDEARRAAEAAEQAATQAAAEHDGLRGRLDGTEHAQLETQAAHRFATEELEAAGLRVASLHDAIEDAEQGVRVERSSADDAIVEAYIRSAGIGGAFWLTDDPGDAVVVAGALAEVAADAQQAVVALSVRRAELAELHGEYLEGQAELAARRGALEATGARLEEAVAALGAEVAAAYQGMQAADAAYRVALDELAEQQRRYNAIRGVEGWRGLVELHFPADLVEQALQVMACESRGNPDATNARSGAAGLFQFLEGTWAWASVSAGYGGASRYDPDPNVAVAAWLVSHSLGIGDPRGPWAHWECQPLS